MNNYQPNYINQPYGIYGMPSMQQQMQRMPQMPQIEPQYSQLGQSQQIYKQPIGLQGKSVDSIDVVRAMDIPLDGSVSYFPLTNGTAIVTKQLQQDGTSKTVVYKPVQEEDKKDEEIPKIEYITNEEFNKQLSIISENNSNLQDGVNNIRSQIEQLSGNLKLALDEIKSFRGGKR